MRTIFTKYNSGGSRGSRITVSDSAGRRRTYGYDHAANCPHRAAVARFCGDSGFSGELIEGHLSGVSRVYLFAETPAHDRFAV